MIIKIKNILSRQDFFPGVLGILINPFYFARLGLYRNIKELSHFISGRVLDVGCGRKPYESLFSVKEYVGMDIKQSGHSHENENIDVFYDGKKFPFENDSFDSIISNQTLEHIFNPNEHLSEILRVLKPDGKFLISVPFLWDEHEQPYDYARYSSFGLKHLLEINGFDIIEQRKSVADVRVIFQLINAYIYKKTFWCRKGISSYAVTILLNAPFNIAGEILGLVLPKNNDLYLDNVVVAVKRK